MAGEFDPYHKWLGIPPDKQPPDRYRLLGVARYESDPDVIESAADRLMLFLRQQANGPHMPLAEKLLSEVALARVGLLDPDEKKQYDAKLRKRRAAAKGAATKGTESRSGSRSEREIGSRVISPTASSTGSQSPRPKNAPSDSKRKAGKPGSSVTERARSRSGRSARRKVEVESEGESPVAESPVAESRNTQLAIVTFAVLSGAIGVGAIFWSMWSNGDAGRQTVAERSSGPTTVATKQPAVPELPELPESLAPLPEAPPASLSKGRDEGQAAKPIGDRNGNPPQLKVQVGPPDFDSAGGIKAAEQQPAEITPEATDEEPGDEEGGIVEEQEGDGPRPTPAAAAQQPKVEASVEPAKKSKETADGGDSVFKSVGPAMVRTSPAWRERATGEKAEDYLVAIGLIEKDGVWVLELEAEVERLIAEFEQLRKEDTAKREAIIRKNKADKADLSRQLKKAKKALDKRKANMDKAAREAADKAFAAEWNPKKQEFNNRAPADTKKRWERAKELARRFEKQKREYTIEHAVMTHSGIHMRQGGEQVEVDAAAAAFEATKANFQTVRNAYAKAHADDLSRAKGLAAAGRKAAAQFSRVKQEYEVLANTSAVTQAITDAGGTLGPSKTFGSLASKANRCRSTGQQNLAQLDERNPFSEAVYHLPSREALVADDAWDALGKTESEYATLRAEDDPVAFLLARGLVQKGDSWRLDAERQLAIDLDLSATMTREIGQLVDAFPEDQAALLARAKKKSADWKKKLDDRFKAKVLIGTTFVHWELEPWRREKRKQLMEAYPIDQLEEKFLAVQDAVADLKTAKAEFLSQAQERAVKIGMAYGELAADEGITEALDKVGGVIQPSAEFNSAVKKIEDLMKRSE